MNKKINFKIGKKTINQDSKTYFIADIGANHNGSLNKAIDLIHSAKENGADAAKFQHFSAETIVSDYGFRSLRKKLSHQSKWKKSVFEVYKDASIDLSWTSILKKTCDEVGIEFFTSPYSFSMVDHINSYVRAFKIGSGDITWHDILRYIASKNKPCIVASGASNLNEVKAAIKIISKVNKKICLMQCNTNYTGSEDNFKYINLNVLKTYKKNFPNIILGLSDHTDGHSTVLGAIALGAKMIEKHYTLNKNREGPDHKFSMDPTSWKEMIDRSNQLEASLGNMTKKIEKNEISTANVQRRSIRLKKSLKIGSKIKIEDLDFLRPCPKNSLPPYLKSKIIGKKLKKNKIAGDFIRLSDF